MGKQKIMILTILVICLITPTAFGMDIDMKYIQLIAGDRYISVFTKGDIDQDKKYEILLPAEYLGCITAIKQIWKNSSS